MDYADSVAIASEARSLVLACDLDGTLAPIVPRPEDARILDTSARALALLARLPLTSVALISGRGDDSLATFAGPLGRVHRGSEHGSVIAFAGGARLRLGRVLEAEERRRLHADFEVAAAGLDGAWVEDKPRGVCLHLRGVDPAQAVQAADAGQRAAAAARTMGLEVIEGRRVVEALARGADKADALRAIVERVASLQSGATAPPLVVYAGDDTTDEPALDFARRSGGLALFVASPERPCSRVAASRVLTSPYELAAWLDSLAQARAR